MTMAAKRTSKTSVEGPSPAELLGERSVKPKLEALTSLRFVAAAAIVLHHSQGLFGLPVFYFDPFRLDQAVCFFFVLSGFILTYVYPDLRGTRKIAQFLRARVGRIWPAHAAVLLLVILLFPRQDWNGLGSANWHTAVANVLMIHAWIPLRDYYSAFNPVSWSISTEFGFYALFPLLIVQMPRRWWLILLVPLVILIGLIWLANVKHLPLGYGDPALTNAQTSELRHHLTRESLTYHSPLGRLLEFSTGMCVGWFWRKRSPRFHADPFFATLAELFAVGLVLLSMVFSFPAAIRLAGILHAGAAGKEYLENTGLVFVPFALLIAVMASEKGPISRALTTRPLVLLGEISYSIYLVHVIPLYFCQRFHGELQVFSNGVQFAFLWAIVLLWAYAQWALVERPGRALIVNLGSARAGVVKPRRLPAGIYGGDARFGIAAALALAALAAPLYWYCRGHQPSFHPITEAQLASMASNTPSEIVNARFENRFILRGLQLVPSGNDFNLHLAWETLSSQRLDWGVGIHLLDHDDHILTQNDYVQNPNSATVAAGTTWQDSVVIRRNQFGPAESLGVVLWKPGEMVGADRGRRDLNHARLIIPLREILPPAVAHQ